MHADYCFAGWQGSVYGVSSFRPRLGLSRAAYKQGSYKKPKGEACSIEASIVKGWLEEAVWPAGSASEFGERLFEEAMGEHEARTANG